VRQRRGKFFAYPGKILEIVKRKDELLARIGAYRQNERVRDLIDLPRLRNLVEQFPSPESVRAELSAGGHPEVPPPMIAALNAMTAAEYLAQHRNQDVSRREALVPSRGSVSKREMQS
jgi:hypothetical protein